MNFTELFDNLPTSTFQDWEAAARKQLKGKALDSIHVSVLEGEEFPPYAMGISSSNSEGGRQGWIQFSSFESAKDLSANIVLEALEGGAQGFEVSFSEVKHISSQLSEVRFDFITLKVNGLLPADQVALVELIPVGQRAESKLVVQLDREYEVADFEHLTSNIGQVVFLLSPKLEVGNQDSLYSVFEEAKRVLSNAQNRKELEGLAMRLGVEINLGSDYIQNIVFGQAIRLLFSNIYHSFGIEEPLPRPYVLGRISPSESSASHELFLIDATARAVAGISGGIDALVIEPYTEGDFSIASRRVRNIQNVLAIEGLMGMPLNAVQGAAFFESAAKALVLSVWPDL